MATLIDIFQGDYSPAFAQFLIKNAIGDITSYHVGLEKTDISPDLFQIVGTVTCHNLNYMFINSYGRKRKYSDYFTFFRIELFNSSQDKTILIEKIGDCFDIQSPERHFRLSLKNNGKIIYSGYRNDHVPGGSFYESERHYLFEGDGYLRHGVNSSVDDGDFIYSTKSYYYKGNKVFAKFFEGETLINTNTFNKKYMKKIHKWL